jgi:hypothetical protein
VDDPGGVLAGGGGDVVEEGAGGVEGMRDVARDDVGAAGDSAGDGVHDVLRAVDDVLDGVDGG